METVKNQVRRFMRVIAIAIHGISHGKITPNSITLIGLVMHLPIAWYIIAGQLKIAGLLLIIFGLFDTLDGELARLQNKTSARGMFLDSATDRIKELVIYIGLTAWLVSTQGPTADFVFLVGALGISLIISYLNAWGEAVLTRHSLKPKHQVNKTFRGGILGFELRMFLLISGLLLNQVVVVFGIIVILGTVTLAARLNSILKKLENV